MVYSGFKSETPLLFLQKPILYFVSLLILFCISAFWTFLSENISNWFILFTIMVFIASGIKACRNVIVFYRQMLKDFIINSDNEEEKQMWIDELKLSDIDLWNKLGRRDKY